VQLTYPSVSGDCLVKILRGTGHVVETISGSSIAYLRRDDVLDWEISSSLDYLGPEIVLMFQTVGLDIRELQNYREKFCSERRTPDGHPVN
jgi:hypothetical protein